MHNTDTDVARLRQVLKSSWWQLDANCRAMVAEHREPLDKTFSRLFPGERRLCVVRHEDHED